MTQASERAHAAMRKNTEKAREERKDSVMRRRRFSDAGDGEIAERNRSPRSLLRELEAARFREPSLLAALRQQLASRVDCATEVFSFGGAVNSLAERASGLDGDATTQLLALQVIANLTPPREKDGIALARAAGPHLVTLLDSGSPRLREASAVALGNLALSGPRVVRVLINQEAAESLVAATRCMASPEGVQGAALFALYHLLHAGGRGCVLKDLLMALTEDCRLKLMHKAPMELHWVLFVLSCNLELHDALDPETVVPRALDICTYEIFQKSDSRPLVKIVTPIVRLLSNLCAGPQSERACMAVLRHPDFLAIAMALLATNYSHLCKETLCWISNIVNNDAMVIQELLVNLDFLEKMEFHTVQAIQKVDPYLTNVIR